MGHRLKVAQEPEWVDLCNGARVFAHPPLTPLVYAARAHAQSLLADLQASGEAVTKVGGRITGVPDLLTPEGIEATTQSLFVLSLAELAVIDWSGILDEDKEDDVPLKYAPHLLVHMMADVALADAFLSKYLGPRNAVVSEGNG